MRWASVLFLSKKALVLLKLGMGSAVEMLDGQVFGSIKLATAWNVFAKISAVEKDDTIRLSYNIWKLVMKWC